MIDDIAQRNSQIAAALKSPSKSTAKELARQYGLSVSHVYRIGKQANGVEQFAGWLMSQSPEQDR